MCVSVRCLTLYVYVWQCLCACVGDWACSEDLVYNRRCQWPIIVFTHIQVSIFERILHILPFFTDVVKPSRKSQLNIQVSNVLSADLLPSTLSVRRKWTGNVSACQSQHFQRSSVKPPRKVTSPCRKGHWLLIIWCGLPRLAEICQGWLYVLIPRTIPHPHPHQTI